MEVLSTGQDAVKAGTSCKDSHFLSSAHCSSSHQEGSLTATCSPPHSNLPLLSRAGYLK